MTHLALALDLADGEPGPVTEWGGHLTSDEYPGQWPTRRSTAEIKGGT